MMEIDILRLGLDLHGVIDSDPPFFSELSHIFKKNGGSVHILTGSKRTQDLEKELDTYSVTYDEILSITDYHLDMNTPITKRDEKENIWFDDLVWNKTKGDYCRKNLIDFHIDDSLNYGKYFSTLYCLFNKNTQIFEWWGTKLRGSFLKTEPETVYSNIIKLVNKHGSLNECR
jgi:hypothetical protein